MIEIEDGSKLPIGKLRKYPSQKRVENYPCKLWGFPLNVSIGKEKGAKEQMIIVSNAQLSDPLSTYNSRICIA